MTSNYEHLFEFIELRELEKPVLILALDGWIDSSGIARSAKESLLSKAEIHTMAKFDTDRLLDHRARRPILELTDGVVENLEWPSIELLHIEGLEGPDACILQGPEPDHDWKVFTDAVTNICYGLDVSLVVGLGAYPAAVPHTRPTRLSCTASSVEMAKKLDFVTASIKVPAGLQAVIEAEVALTGTPSIGLWAQVPHYLSTGPYPPAAVELLEGLRKISGIYNQDLQLDQKALNTRSRLDQLIGKNEEHLAMIEKLEIAYDQLNDPAASLPSGDDLAEELQNFLRTQDES
ncbi:MAG: hypothetical protein CL517_06100 [Actinobacteria bacterium]|nr:hypothetical protein [Actinomycetota bacterium]MEC7810338.1 PAC2 family protein [Actinomycetota bacterium]|tara:strand:+ start:1608 stop:2480 length:873 start_codon:yes stop_codon:yes gene_type:complete